MDATVLKMAIAGFMHDIGKFADKEALDVTPQYINDNSFYLKYWDGRPAYHHAVYTAAFIEYLKADLPDQLNEAQWGEGDAFVNLAAGHHNPQTPMQHIVRVADWLTAGMDRDIFDSPESQKIPPSRYKSTRLLPIFEQLRRPEIESLAGFKYAYPLATLSPRDIFPLEAEKAKSLNVKSEYKNLFDDFAQQLKKLKHREENLSLWFEHFESLFMTYTSQIPSARAGLVVPDVSLYDHCRLTSAFAAALYHYHRETDSLSLNAINDWEVEKFILVSGDFFGIQNFIFACHGETRKYRSKLLRGRSFYVSLLCELAADMLCREIQLPPTSVILNAAGRFTVLAPNTPPVVQKIKKVNETINRWLFDNTYGEVSIGLSWVTAAHQDFLSGKFQHLWDRIVRRSEERKYNKIDLDQYGGAVSGYLDSFDNTLDSPVCPLCGKRPADEKTVYTRPSQTISPVCLMCRDHVLLGTHLVRDECIVITDDAGSESSSASSLMLPVLGRYGLRFVAADDVLDKEEVTPVKYWNLAVPGDKDETGGVTRKFLNGYVPVYSDKDLHDDRILATRKMDFKKEEMIEEIRPGAPKTFSHIAARALNLNQSGRYDGIDALGVLKADVDSLGILMSCGLSGQRHTVSRLATLSRQINYFFTLYLPDELSNHERFKDIYTVFAGGDDLFLIGPWNCIHELALHLDSSFGQYVCGNSNVHFSAGISLHKAHAPLDHLADSAGAALENSKNRGRNRLTFFSRTVEWTVAREIENVRREMEQWIEKQWISRSMLYRLNHFIDLSDAEKGVLQRDRILIADMGCLKWRALFLYSAKRNIGKKIRDSKERQLVVEELVSKMAGWLDKYAGTLRIPLWIVLYNMR